MAMVADSISGPAQQWSTWLQRRLCKVRLSSRHNCGPKSSTQFSGKIGFLSMNSLVFTLKLRRYVSTRQRDVPALRYEKDSMMRSKKGTKGLPCVYTSANALHARLPVQRCSYCKRLRASHTA